ncbi:MAG: hypothetical protein HLUCCO18_16145 [Rhodobacteraceae bacterium HLUCCO18]|nr:MAG: hypothetical protein HLUCCO18_16145 [Rhodobacteraceae bacterium HLUCCO18]
MMVLALRADRRLAPGRAMLPMNFAPDGTVIRHAPRRIALWFMPALGVVVFVPLALFAPGTPGALIAATALLSGQLFFHWLIGRTA